MRRFFLERTILYPGVHVTWAIVVLLLVHRLQRCLTGKQHWFKILGIRWTATPGWLAHPGVSRVDCPVPVQIWLCWLVLYRRWVVVPCELAFHWSDKNKWNESGFRPPLCTYRPNWARRTSWGWWDEWDDTVLQTQDSKFEPRRSEAEHATYRSRRLPTILTFTRGWGRNIFCFFWNRRDREPNPDLWRERQRC